MKISIYWNKFDYASFLRLFCIYYERKTPTKYCPNHEIASNVLSQVCFPLPTFRTALIVFEPNTRLSKDQVVIVSREKHLTKYIVHLRQIHEVLWGWFFLAWSIQKKNTNNPQYFLIKIHEMNIYLLANPLRKDTQQYPFRQSESILTPKTNFAVVLLPFAAKTRPFCPFSCVKFSPVFQAFPARILHAFRGKKYKHEIDLKRA